MVSTTTPLMLPSFLQKDPIQIARVRVEVEGEYSPTTKLQRVDIRYPSVFARANGQVIT